MERGQAETRRDVVLLVRAGEYARQHLRARLRSPDRHRFWPLFKRRVSNKRSYGHSGPHRSPVYVLLIRAVGLTAGEYHLKT